MTNWMEKMALALAATGAVLGLALPPLQGALRKICCERPPMWMKRSFCLLFALAALLSLFMSFALAADREKIVHVYGADGAENPTSTLISDSLGNLYGTTFYDNKNDAGTVFALLRQTSGGRKYKLLHRFRKFEGCYPEGTLVIDSDGILFGTTFDGAAHDCGSVYQIKQASSGKWAETTLHSFGGGDCYAIGGLAIDKQHNLYGTTASGGKDNLGVAFKMTRKANGHWSYTRLHNFNTNEPYPTTNLVIPASGNIYGGDQNGIFVLQFRNGKWSEHTAYTFRKKTDGFVPHGDLVFDPHGNLYGTTSVGGAFNFGAAYVLTNVNGKWTSTVMHSFGEGQDGRGSLSGVTITPTGSVVGTTTAGGAYNRGIIYELTPNNTGWRETILHSFAGGTDGNRPVGGLFVESSGTIDGTTYDGGARHQGIAFQLTAH